MSQSTTVCIEGFTCIKHVKFFLSRVYQVIDEQGFFIIFLTDIYKDQNKIKIHFKTDQQERALDLMIVCLEMVHKMAGNG